MARLYFICILHNKIKVGGEWRKFHERIQRIILRRAIKMQKHHPNCIPLHVVKTSCDECQDMYPFFG